MNEYVIKCYRNLKEDYCIMGVYLVEGLQRRLVLKIRVRVCILGKESYMSEDREVGFCGG